MGYTYNFPKIKGLRNFRKDWQIEKIEEELEELKFEVQEYNDQHAILEAMDVLIATETFLRLFPDGGGDYLRIVKQPWGYCDFAVKAGERE